MFTWNTDVFIFCHIIDVPRPESVLELTETAKKTYVLMFDMLMGWETTIKLTTILTHTIIYDCKNCALYPNF